MSNYVTFHCHTELSLVDSCTNYKLYVDKAIELGQTAICFTEHANIYNWIEKKMYCDQQGIKYIHGTEIYLTETLEEKIKDNYHTVLIAKNYEGFKEINTLLDLSTQPDHVYYKNRISFDEFLNISNNVIKTSACLQSPLAKLDFENPYYEKLLKKYDYLEIQPHNIEKQKEFNLKLYKLSKRHNIPLIVGTDTHSLNPYKEECREILHQAKKWIYDSQGVDLTYKTYDELTEMFKTQGVLAELDYLEAINNTNIMAESIEPFELDLSFKYLKLYNNEEEVFLNRIEEKYNYKVKNNIISDDPQYKECIQEEYRVLKKIGMIGFILFMSELLTWCRENNIPFGHCRGSVGGSVIAYILDIIDLNPITWKTIFSRFANEDRIEIGDIDVDFAPSQRDLVYQYIINRIGIDNTAFILAIDTISDKGTIDEIGRALHYKWKSENEEKINKKELKETDSPYHVKRIEEIKLKYEYNPEKTRQEFSDLFYYFDGLLGTAISQSMHPAGIIASPVTLFDNYGTFWNDDKRIVYINMEEVHEVSLVKYDILGLKNIEIIKDTCELIGIPYPLSHEINWNDQNVWNDIITSNVGVFQFESDYSFSLLKRYKPQKINDLSLVNACLRPSGSSYRDKLINREFNKNPSKLIDDLLKDNNGFLVFQEDVIAFLQHICGLTGSEADNVRRAIGRKQRDRLEKALPQILEGYCNKSDKSREEAEQEATEFLKIIEDASSYMFGYNHSTGYSMIGYLCGYYRYYYPLEFTTAYLKNAKNQKDIDDGTKLAKIKGLNIKPIRFGYSAQTYFPDKESNSIYKGISSIKGFGEKLDISGELNQFKNKQYKYFIDLLIDIKENTGIGDSKIEILIKLNYFDKFGKNKKLLTIFNEFTTGKNRYQKKHTEKTKLKRIPLLYEFEESVEDIALPIIEQINIETELLGIPMTTYQLPQGSSYIIDLDLKNSPKASVYGLSTGILTEVKIYKNTFKKLPFQKGDIVQFLKLKKKPKVKFVGKNENGKPKFEPIEGEWDIWSVDDQNKKNIPYKIMHDLIIS